MKTTVFGLLFFCISVLTAQETTVSGKLLGWDGKPIPLAQVELFLMSSQRPLASLEVSKDGSYKISAKETGMLRIQFAGVNHMPSNIPLLVETHGFIDLNVSLAAYPYKEKIEAPQIIGDFNNFNFNSPREMEKQADGTFMAEFETEQKEFKYQIINVLAETRSINGTQSDRFQYDGGGDYQSIVAVNQGKARIVFDPRKIQRSTAQEKFSFGGKNTSLEQFVKAYKMVMDQQAAFQKAAAAFQATGKDMKEFRYDVSGTLSSVAKAIASEKDSYGRQLLLMQYLGVSTMAREGVDSLIARQALSEIPPESGLWSVTPSLIMSALFRAGSGFDANAYIDAFLPKNLDRGLKSSLLFNLMMSARYEQNNEKYKKYYTTLVEEYGDTQYGMMAKQRFTPESAIVVGKKSPAFRLASLTDPDKSISNELLKGKTTLLDFWAVWCGPCIGEMENMHKAYERFKGKNFQIISFSFDAKPDDVTQFRSKKWKMPWLHAFVEKGFESDLAKRFEVLGIPKPILVDGEGTILAVDVELRGTNLEKTLERVLGK